MSVVESSEVRYGRVLEGAHIAGYTFARMQTELLWLLEGTRWQEIGRRHSDVNDFLRSIDLSAWKIEDRPKLVRAIKAAQPKASNRAIAAALGADESTVRADAAGNPASANGAEPSSDMPTAGNPAPAFADGEQAHKAAQKKKGRTGPPPPPLTGSYGLIYADPPWRYDFSETDSRRVENQYSTLSLEEICALPIPSEPDCVLYMWATAPKLREALAVITAWGFEYVTNAVWVKDKIGMGYWFRGRHELLMVAKRGAVSPPEESLRPDSVIEAPRGEHSAKPQAVYEVLERLYPDSSKIELFARTQRTGWEAWGNELPA